MARWHWFSTASLHYQCRKCGAKFRLTARGWFLTLAVCAVQILIYVLYRWRILPWHVGIGLLLIILGLALWLLPYLTPVRLSGQPKPQSL